MQKWIDKQIDKHYELIMEILALLAFCFIFALCLWM